MSVFENKVIIIVIIIIVFIIILVGQTIWLTEQNEASQMQCDIHLYLLLTEHNQKHDDHLIKSTSLTPIESCFSFTQDGKGLSLQRIKTMNESIKQCRQVLWIAEGKLASVALDGTIQVSFVLL